MNSLARRGDRGARGKARFPLSFTGQESAFTWVAIIIAVALLIGGGGRPGGLWNVPVFLAALLGLGFAREAAFAFFKTAPRGLVVLTVLTVLLPLLQLIPLPASVWQSLPGRDLLLESLSLVEATDSWRPVSLEPSTTMLSLIGLYAPLAVIVLAYRLPTTEHRKLVMLLFAGCLVAFIYAAAQFATDGAILDFYKDGGIQRFVGLFSNQNTAGLFFVVCLCLLVAMPTRGRGPDLWSRFAIPLALLLALGVVLTQSRSAIALILVPVALAAARFAAARRTASIDPKIAMAGLGALLLVVAGVAGLMMSERVSGAVDRFGLGSDGRIAVWEDGQESVRRYWPMGAGVGTFDSVFEIDEALEHVDPTNANRAHNDYMETAIEAGIFGLALAFAWLVYGIFALWKALAGARFRGLAIGAGAALVCIAAQSALDYPLRSQGFFCVAAFLFALLRSGWSTGKGVESA